MEFGIEKCAMFIMKNWKRWITEEIKLPNQGRIRTLGEKENYKYLGMLEVDTIKQVETNAKNSISLDKWVNFSELNSATENSSKE